MGYCPSRPSPESPAEQICRNQGVYIRRKSCATHLESVNLSSLFFIPMGGPKAHVKLRTVIVGVIAKRHQSGVPSITKDS
jgi:hypothetical protein